MHELTIGVVKSDFHDRHTSSWSSEWLKYCAYIGVTSELIDWRSLNAFERLLKCDIVLWHFSHYSSDEMAFATKFLLGLKAAGCMVFPDIEDSYHFDDKIAQSYLFHGLGLRTPKNYPLYSKKAVEEWLYHVNEFPVVGKLRTGSGANNVTLLKHPDELKRYAKKLFKIGVSGRPNSLLKIKSNLASVSSINDFWSRIKRASEFKFARDQSRGLARERGYVYLQEFIPGADHDLKVVVVGDKLSFVARQVRKGDFRASGGGSLSYDHSFIDKDIIDAAFNAADAIGSRCTGFDIIKDPQTGECLILEVSYSFSHWAQLGLGGFYDRKGEWKTGALNAPCQVLEDMIAEIKGVNRNPQ